MKYTPVKGPKPHSEEWLTLRKFDAERSIPLVVGASTGAAVAGVNPYESCFEAYLYARGDMEKEFSPDQLDRMRMGNKLEPIIISEYEEKTGKSVDSDVNMHFHPLHPWMAATPDGRVVGENIGIEAKATTFRMYDRTGEKSESFGEDGTDQVPLMYAVQAQWQMAVFGYDRVDFPVLFDGTTLRIYHVDRDETIIENLIAAGEDFVSRVASSNPPDPDFTRTETAAALRAHYGLEEGSAIEFSEEQEDLWWEYKSLKSAEKASKDSATAIQNRILAAMQGNAQADLPSGKKLKRSVSADTYFTQQDVEDIIAKVDAGEIKRRGYERLSGPTKRPEMATV